MRNVLRGLAVLPLYVLVQSIDVRADRDSHVYRCGEEATFTVCVLGEDKQAATSGEVRMTFTNLGTQQVAERE